MTLDEHDHSLNLSDRSTLSGFRPDAPFGPRDFRAFLCSSMRTAGLAPIIAKNMNWKPGRSGPA